MKRPSLQFYAGDWLHDTGLRACSLVARGLWIDMLAYMHQGSPYGYLTLPASKDGNKDVLKPIHPPILARMVGASPEEVDSALRELENAGVFSRNSEGIIFSRRMVRDEALRQIRAGGGVESLKHPNVPPKKSSDKDPPKDSLCRSLRGSPSSSSSSSSSAKDIRSESSASEAPSRTFARQVSHQPSAAGMRMADLLRDRILANNPRAKITASQLKQWASEADRMMRLDDRSEQEISELIIWSQKHDFWCTNILSMGKLREKFDQLTIQRNGRPGDGPGRETPLETEDKPAPPKWKGLYDDDAQKEPVR